LRKHGERPRKQIVDCRFGKAESWRLEERYALGWRGGAWSMEYEGWRSGPAGLEVGGEAQLAGGSRQ